MWKMECSQTRFESLTRGQSLDGFFSVSSWKLKQTEQQQQVEVSSTKGLGGKNLIEKSNRTENRQKRHKNQMMLRTTRNALQLRII